MLWQASWIRGAKPCDVIPQRKTRSKHQKKQTKKHHRSNKKNKTQKQPANRNQTHPQKNHKTVEWRHHELQVKNAITRQLMCLVPSRPSIETTEGQTQKTLPDGPTGAKQKSCNAETRDPPSQDPGGRNARPCRHDKHQRTSTASICQACEKDECETTVRHTEWNSNYIRPPLRVLSCVLWRLSKSHIELTVRWCSEGCCYPQLM